MPTSIDKRASARLRALAHAEAITPEEDAAITAAAEADPDNPPLTDEDFARMRPRGRPRGAVAKVSVTVRLDEDVVSALKEAGRGWQTRLNETLRQAVLPKAGTR
jgi:uncharacterized protein (DUF4415 family)